MWTHQSRVNLLICIHQGPWLQSQREVFESLKVNMALTEVFREKEALLHNVLQKGTGVVIQIRHGPGMIGSLVEKAFPGISDICYLCFLYAFLDRLAPCASVAAPNDCGFCVSADVESSYTKRRLRSFYGARPGLFHKR